MSLRSAAAHRNLLYLLTLKELRTRYKQSVLGWAWSLLNPITQMLIFTFVFLYVFDAAAPVGDPSGLAVFPLYFLSGVLPFNFLSISVSVAISAVQGGSGLIKKVRFPHEHLVFSVITAQQAPMPFISRQAWVCAWPLTTGTDQIALTKAHSTKPMVQRMIR